MSLQLPSRRVVRQATALATTHPSLPFLVPCIQRRTAFWSKTGSWDVVDPKSKPENPLTEGYLKRKPKQEMPTPGGLAPSSIFQDPRIAGPLRANEQKTPPTRNPHYMAAALDPDPASRKRWERKMVIRQIHKRGRLSRTEQLKQQEKVLLSKSHDFKTSVKKLVPLAKQITGKTVEEAIVQMRFSAKKAAKDVKEHLEHARNEAIVRRSMGLPEKGFTPIKIQTKDGKRVTVESPTTLYVDQAWCGRGLYGKTPDYRARGVMNIMKNRTTSLSVVLKEEKTRIRLHEERETKERRKKVWVQLPNKPVTAQRQYYSW